MGHKNHTNPTVHIAMVTLLQDNVPGHVAFKISILVPSMKSVYLNNWKEPK